MKTHLFMAFALSLMLHGLILVGVSRWHESVRAPAASMASGSFSNHRVELQFGRPAAAVDHRSDSQPLADTAPKSLERVADVEADPETVSMRLPVSHPNPNPGPDQNSPPETIPTLKRSSLKNDIQASPLHEPRPVLRAAPSTLSYSASKPSSDPRAAPRVAPDRDERTARPIARGVKQASLGPVSGTHGRVASGGVKVDTRGGTDTAALMRLVREAVARHKHYPARARRRGWQGRPQIGFSLDESGIVRDVRVLQSSGHATLDKAALKAVLQASPIVGADPYLRSPLQLRLGIRFQLD